MGDSNDDERGAGDRLDHRLVTHLLTVLSVSAGMVGVCLTAIGLVGLLTKQASIETICDELLAVNSFLYLGTALLSFLALRSPLRRRADSIALAVDILFCLSLALTAVACGFLVFVARSG